MKFPTTKAFPLNWENGMKLSATHFQHLENSVEDAVRDARAIALTAGGSFGLLPNSRFSIRNAQGVNPQSVQVILEACEAIMPGGYRVEILPENMQHLRLPERPPFVEFIPSAGVRYHLFLTIDDKKGRIPGGNPETRPIRQPYLVHNYRLECIPHDKLPTVRTITANRMKIAEWQDRKIIEGYIPPVLTVAGYELLSKWHHFFQNQLENMVRMSTKVIQEHRKKDVARAAFCSSIVHYIRSSKGHFTWVIPNQSPIYLVAYYGDLAGMIKGLLETSDRDFVRNQLQEGQVNELLPTIDLFLKMNTIPLEEIAGMINRMQRFGEALILTLQKLATYQQPKPKSGERGEINITSG